MNMKQILIFGLFLVPLCTSRCYNDQELSLVAKRKLSRHYPQPPEPPAETAGPKPSCPVEHYSPSQELRNRSLSPWRLVRVTNEDYFPSSYAEAQCLCSGCILIQGTNHQVVESNDYNSKEIKQNRVFLKKERCRGGKTYKLTRVSVEVAVGCTCARPSTSTST
uniref:interleukin-17C n=1 Tax=Monopterus albus TaxID=43700 RepID=UPI0009B4523B|nr:interleukin-17F-like [Monopterus albus]